MSPLQPRPTERRPPVPQLATALLSLAALVLPLPGAVEAQTLSSLGGSAAAPAVEPLLGPRSPLPKDWVGTRGVSPAIPILMLAGHADAQGIGGSGTSGEAVGLYGAAPMRPGISDEHYWCLQVAHAVAVLGRQRGLNINFYIPPVRTMLSGDESGTNWSVGREHAAAGGYALEIHFDAYGSAGVGSGLIPPLHRQFSTIDESLAQEFGSFPMNFRDQLGGPKRGIGLLEVGKLEGPLEGSLRDPRTRKRTIQYIAQRVVYAIQRGIATPGSATTTGLLPALPPPQPPVVAGP
jgi:hypothetical protein